MYQVFPIYIMQDSHQYVKLHIMQDSHQYVKLHIVLHPCNTMKTNTA